MEILHNETWKTIKYFPDYLVSNLGRVKSLKFGKEKILKQCKNNKTGHLQVILYNNKTFKIKKTHRLVFENFNDYMLKNSECVHHIDNNPINNCVKNLELTTKENHNRKHCIGKKRPEHSKVMSGRNHTEETKKLIGEKMKGENNPRAILKEIDVYDIREYLKLKLLTIKQLSWIFDVSRGTISRIKSGRNWNNIKEGDK